MSDANNQNQTDNTNTPATPDTGQLEQRIAGLTKESAGYRVQRNDALRQNHLFKEVLSKHGIDTGKLSSYDLSKLSIEDGVVKGAVGYQPPKPEKVSVGQSSKAVNVTAEPPLTLEEVEKNWSAERINKNWDKVKALMEKS